MLPPEAAYQYQQPIDFTSGGIQLLQRELSGQAAAVQITTAPFTVPNDRVLILSNMSIATVAGAAQTTTSSSIRAGGETSGDIEISTYPETGSFGSLNTRENWQGNVWLPPGSIVVGSATFSAGAAANTVFLRIFGMLIPRANVQQG